jgi:arylsulfatase A-like enzyme
MLWGLYLSGVARADARLAELRSQLGEAGVADPITIVTSDHGEHFGEHRLFQHELGVYDELLHVPLVVHGVRGAGPAVIDEPVQLADVMPSVLAWAGLPIPRGVTGRRLPTVPDAAPEPRTLIAENIEPGAKESGIGGWAAAMRAASRRACGPADQVDGTLRAAIRFPFKLILSSNHPGRLFDLSKDPAESEDLAARHPARVAALAAELGTRIAAARPPRPGPAGAPAEDPTLLDRLRALGYVGRPEDVP